MLRGQVYARVITTPGHNNASGQCRDKCFYNGKIYKYIFIVINRLIKIRYFIPITSLDTKELIKAFIYTIYKLYSALNTIVSNRGSLFISNF